MPDNRDIEQTTTIWHLAPLRVTCFVISGIFLAISLMADKFGFGQPGSFGIGQLLLALFGFFVLLLGLLGKRIVELYRGAAILLLNTLVLLAVLELMAIVIARSGVIPSYRQEVLASYQGLPYYASQDWTEDYWREAAEAENYRYEPYVVWRHLPFDGQTIHINEEGIRETPGAECGVEAYKVFTLGGSSMWGWGSPDWGTIPAYLQLGLEDRMQKPVCVTNFGEDAFVSTQSLIELTRQLQIGNIPDLVIFYDGVNDVYAVYDSGELGVHSALRDAVERYEENEHPLVKWFKSSRQFQLFERFIRNLTTAKSQSNQINGDGRTEMDTQRLVKMIVQPYLNNYRMVSALAQEYGFEYAFFWQPHLAIGRKELSPEEQLIKARLNTDLVALAKAVYDDIASLAPEYENLWDISNVLDEEDTQIWIDEWGWTLKYLSE
jgi:hypothetical protein